MDTKPSPQSVRVIGISYSRTPYVRVPMSFRDRIKPGDLVEWIERATGRWELRHIERKDARAALVVLNK
jgi:hypothetical protein